MSYGARLGVMRNTSKSRFKMLNDVKASTRTWKRQLIGKTVSAGEGRELVSCSWSFRKGRRLFFLSTVVNSKVLYQSNSFSTTMLPLHGYECILVVWH